MFLELQGDHNDIVLDHNFTAAVERFWETIEKSSSS
jgi:hypothetical protein